MNLIRFYRQKIPVMRRQYLQFNCKDCGADTIAIGEYYIVRDEVWALAWPGYHNPRHGKLLGERVLCIGCLENRLGRTLTRADFVDVPANDLNNPEYHFSDRLRARLSAINSA